MITLSSTELRILAPIALLMALVSFATYVGRRRRVARALGDSSVIRQLLGFELAAAPWMRLGAVACAAALMAAALLDPAIALPRSSPRGPIVLLLDASGSMLVEDVTPNRLEAQRTAVNVLIRGLPDIPIGVVVFAGRAYSLTPPTRDRSSIDMYVRALDPTIVTQSGSALGAAIRQGVGLLSSPEGTVSGSLVLIGDGDETEASEAAADAIQVARQNGIRIYTIGVGTQDGGPVPAIDVTTGQASGYLRDPAGQPINSTLDEGLLEEVARSTGGLYAHVQNDQSLDRLRDEISGLSEATPVNSDDMPPYAWLALVALGLLLVEPLGGMGGRR